jgi:membrane-associated phospholipid phosphatase
MDILTVWYFITLLGTPEYWAAIAAGLVAVYFILRFSVHGSSWKKYKPTLKRLLIVFIPSLLIVFGLTIALKDTLNIPRPCTPCSSLATGIYPTGTDLSGACNPYCDSDSSFPSGHAATAFTVFSSLYFTFRRRLAIPLFIIPILVAYSRVALGVHTYLDILVGALLGLAMPLLVSVMLQKRHKSR